MVLINSHTISKSIANDEKFDDIFDSLTDLDYTQSYGHKYDRYNHKYRRDGKLKDTTKTHQEQSTQGAEKTTKSTQGSRLETTTGRSKTKPTFKHTGPLVQGLWKRIQNKFMEIKQKEDTASAGNFKTTVKAKRQSKASFQLESSQFANEVTPKTYFNSLKKHRKHRKHATPEKTKREVTDSTAGTLLYIDATDKDLKEKRRVTTKTMNITPYAKMQKAMTTVKSSTATTRSTTTSITKATLKDTAYKENTDKYSDTRSSADDNKNNIDKFNTDKYDTIKYNKDKNTYSTDFKYTTGKKTSTDKNYYIKNKYTTNNKYTNDYKHILDNVTVSPPDTQPLEEATTTEATTSQATTEPTSTTEDWKHTYNIDEKKSTLFTPGPTKTDTQSLDHSTSDFRMTDSPEMEYAGTAALETLLNEIKMRAMQMISEQDPGVSDIISNTVTESTFENDPLLISHFHKAGMPSFISINKNKKVCLTEDPMQVTSAISYPTHNIESRSIKEDAITMAKDIDNKLQEEIKEIYCKIKQKIEDARKSNCTTKKCKSPTKPSVAIITPSYKQGDHSMNKPTEKKMQPLPVYATQPGNKAMNKLKTHANPTIHVSTNKIMTTAKLVTTKLTTKHKYKVHKWNTSSRPHRRSSDSIEKQLTKQYAKHKRPGSTRTIPTMDDDYAMLTLFEQLLSKTHEDNVMKMLTTRAPNVTKWHCQKQRLRLSKRNPETLADLSLKETIRKENDGEGMPEDAQEYRDRDTYRSRPPDSSEFLGYDDDEGPVASTLDTSFEGLSNKISYNEYVDGYRHYLNFAKELNNQNFSNRIRFQAHMHHNVDDIGKYILNKLPPMPEFTGRYRRHFFEYTDMEDQDISTKSDDSWFKKHFYLFIDTASPKKFHTSQNVSLKTPVATETEKTTANNVKNGEKKNREVFETEEEEDDGFAITLDDPQNTEDSYLDEMMKTMQEETQTLRPVSPQGIIYQNFV